MLCRSCGKKNEDGVKYCVYCGECNETTAAVNVAAPVENPTKPCSSCGKKNLEEVKYCVYCGATTDSKKITWWGKFTSLLPF